jgi:hypothetical protein
MVRRLQCGIVRAGAIQRGAAHAGIGAAGARCVAAVYLKMVLVAAAGAVWRRRRLVGRLRHARGCRDCCMEQCHRTDVLDGGAVNSGGAAASAAPARRATASIHCRAAMSEK